MVSSTRSRIYDADSAMGRIQGRTLLPASPTAAANVAAAVVEHHSNNQNRDGRGRFIKGYRTSNAQGRRTRTRMNPRRTQEEDKDMVPVQAQDAEGEQVVVPPPVDEIPKHDFVIVCNRKVSIHCTFSHDSDDET
ncbi:unnamed protein product [Urochloa humidicola]